MNTYTMTEKQNLNSEREGVEITASTLTAAKIKSSKMQAFFGTVIELTDSAGNTVAVKEKDGSWIKQAFFDA